MKCYYCKKEIGKADPIIQITINGMIGFAHTCCVDDKRSRELFISKAGIMYNKRRYIK